jgi:hypothetical protein
MDVCIDLIGGKNYIHVIVFILFSYVGLESESRQMHLCHILRKYTGGCSSLRKVEDATQISLALDSFELTVRTPCSGL